MKSKGILKQLGLGVLWLGLFTILATVLLSFVGVTNLSQSMLMGTKQDVDSDLPILERDSHGSYIPGIIDQGLISNYRGWKGDFYYKLEHNDGFYRGSAEFLKLKGLKGETVEDIEVKGHVVFTPARGNVLYAGEGAVNYSIARMSLSAMGDAMVVHFTDGNGVDKVKKNLKGTYLRMNRAAGNYSFRIEPGSYEADIDAFGVKVLTSTEMKAARALIEKMESEGRPVPYSEKLIKMFPEYDWSPGRDHIVLEAFDMPLPKSGNTLSGIYKDEKGGVLSWKFVAF